MKVFLPYRGEFGHKLMWHVPTVHAVNEPKIVCIEQGEEAIYPNAIRYFIVPRINDSHRRSRMADDYGFGIGQLPSEIIANAEFVKPHKGRLSFFIPQPVVRRGISADVVLCPRLRQYGTQKNWEHWTELSEELCRGFRVFSGGAPDSSCTKVSGDAAWNYERFLDATIEAILSSRLVVATDSGLAYLALICGKPVCMITHEDGLTAPGYRRVNMMRYASVNHTNAAIHVVKNAWHSIAPVVSEIQKMS